MEKRYALKSLILAHKEDGKGDGKGKANLLHSLRAALVSAVSPRLARFNPVHSLVIVLLAAFFMLVAIIALTLFLVGQCESICSTVPLQARAGEGQAGKG